MRKIAFAAVAAVLIFAGALFWLLGTPSGARWVMKAASSRAGLILHAQKVEGRLLGELRVEGLTVQWSGGMLRSGRLTLRWQPLSLLSATVSVERLECDRLEIIDNSSGRPSAVDLTWPRVTGLPLLVDAAVELLRVEHLTYRRKDGPPVEASFVESSLLWRAGKLDISLLHLESEPARIKGLLSIGLAQPSLLLSANAVLTRPQQGIDRLTVHAVLTEGQRKDEQVAGRITLSAMSETSRMFSCVSEVRVASRSVGIKDLVLIAEGRRGTVRGDGEIDFPGGLPRVALRAGIDDLDLARETGFLSHLSGSLEITAVQGGYRGTFDLANYGAGWRRIGLSGPFEGNAGSARLPRLRGRLLDGTVSGNLEAGWTGLPRMSGSLSGRGLDPSVISPAWHGSLGFDLEGKVAEEEGGLKGFVSGHLLESSLRGVKLGGDMQARLEKGELVSAGLRLTGKDLLVSASGDPRRRLSFEARADDLSAIVPDGEGRVSAEGWARFSGGRVSGSAIASGRKVGLKGLRIGSFEASGSLGASGDRRIKVRTTMRNAGYESMKVDTLTVLADGSESAHTIEFVMKSGPDSLRASFQGGYADGAWQGSIKRISGRDKAGGFRTSGPSDLKISSSLLELSPVVLLGEEGEKAELSAELHGGPLRGRVHMEWARLNLLHGGWLVSGLGLSGATSGSAEAEMSDDRLRSLAAGVSASGKIDLGGKAVGFRNAAGTVRWEGSGLSVSLSADLSEGGRLKGHFSSSAPASFSPPATGAMDLAWSGIDLGMFRRWLPPEVGVEGSFAGTAAGTWAEGGRLGMKAATSLSNGKLAVNKGGGTIKTEIRSAAVTADWSGERLEGAVSLDLAEYGTASGEFTLPIPARLPAGIERRGPISIAFHGKAHEKGFLSSLFPGLAEESRGEIDASITVTGQWESPVLSGEVLIGKAGAYFPAAGIHISNVSMRAGLGEGGLKITSFHVESGGGSIDGEAVARLRGWKVEDYRGSIKGDRFQVFYLPELRASVSPSLSFEGTAERIAVTGEVRVPELLVAGSKKEVVRPSPDVVMAGAAAEKNGTPRVATDMDVTIVLGDRVFVKDQGIDARLGGKVRLTAANLKDVRGQGTITVIKGRYSAYGVNLDIEKGRILFSGGPADNPSLEVLALRKAGDVKAGVLVTGTLASPQVRLYSDPSMSDTDTLSYIVLGHPAGTGSREETSLLVGAASQLLSASQSVTLQDKIKRSAGLDTLDIETAGGAAEGGGAARSIVTVGKYLTPGLYISYGRSLFGTGDLVKARYSLSRKWEIDVSSGAESGADIFYKIEFR